MRLALPSPLLEAAGFVHGFSVRTGGLSAPPFDSLNLARSVGDDLVKVAENHGRLARDVGYAPASLYEVSQVHGATVRLVLTGDEPEQVRVEEADALVATVGGTVVGVRVADCLPLLLADVRTGAVAAVHCGWRGVAAAIVDRALDALFSAGSRPGDLRAAIGPHIRACCFEVGDEVVASLGQVAHGVAFVTEAAAGERPHVDLAAVVGAQLDGRGVTTAQRDDIGGCTRCDAASFYSYRRDGARSGRHLAVIAVR